MHYVISDIHGCYYVYLKALERIDFKDEDILYVLGDCVDRGYAPIRLLQDMMRQPNIIPLIGNHELEASLIHRKLCVEITEKNYNTHLDEDFMEVLTAWFYDGGHTTLEEFQKLSMIEQEEILSYMGEFSLYKETVVNGQSYLMVHGGLEPFDPQKKLKDYDLFSLVTSRPDYEKAYFKDRYTITGHSPTPNQEGNLGTIIKKNNHIAIDCGCVFGYNLAVLCLETGEEYYIPFQDGRQSPSI